MFTYKTNGTCSTQIDLEIQDGVITYCKFTRGCKGNTEGLARSVIGRKADEIAEILAGIECRGNTSCPDQLSKAIKAYHELAGCTVRAMSARRSALAKDAANTR